MHDIWTAMKLNTFYISFKFYDWIVDHSVRLYNAKTFSSTQAHISESSYALYLLKLNVNNYL